MFWSLRSFTYFVIYAFFEVEDFIYDDLATTGDHEVSHDDVVINFHSIDPFREVR